MRVRVRVRQEAGLFGYRPARRGQAVFDKPFLGLREAM